MAADITFSKIPIIDLPESTIAYLEKVQRLCASIVSTFVTCTINPSIFDLDADADIEAATDEAHDMEPGPAKKAKLAQLRLRRCFDERIADAVEVLGRDKKSALYAYIATADRGKLNSYYMDLASHTVNLLIHAIKVDRAYPGKTKSYLLIGSVGAEPRIYMSCSPGLGVDENIQEHIYIFRDPIKDLLDIFSGNELPKGLAMKLHLYGISEFEPTYLTTSPIKVMDELLSKQPFLEPVECPPPGCPRKYFFGHYNTRIWKIKYDHL